MGYVYINSIPMHTEFQAGNNVMDDLYSVRLDTKQELVTIEGHGDEGEIVIPAACLQEVITALEDSLSIVNKNIELQEKENGHK